MSIDYSKFAYPKPPKTEKKKKQPIKGKKHRQTKETEISKATKLLVWERDKFKCVLCGKQVSWHYANAHYKPRSAGGLGIPENLITACSFCHREQDNGLNTIEYTHRAKEYLQKIYGSSWNEDNLIYKK